MPLNLAADHQVPVEDQVNPAVDPRGLGRQVKVHLKDPRAVVHRRDPVAADQAPTARRAMDHQPMDLQRVVPLRRVRPAVVHPQAAHRVTDRRKAAQAIPAMEVRTKAAVPATDRREDVTVRNTKNDTSWIASKS